MKKYKIKVENVAIENHEIVATISDHQLAELLARVELNKGKTDQSSS